ncbi:winged helix-turn-helix transcriptional regulator [Halobellus sp. GM3]|uniref:winged helix-turn-helix transcriptional regulator n=1 Tax=Halobellus sp. GM3 TaxID=3458410 RepID=UPI00403D771C
METHESNASGIWNLLGCKWTFHIVRLLDRRDARFNQIKTEIEGLPASTLSARLESLREEGLVERDVDETATPPTVTYALTEKGTELAGILGDVEDLQRRYD